MQHCPPPRPKMPTAVDDERVEHTLGRVQLLQEAADAVAREWAEANLAKEQLETWGPMDTSTNPLGDYARQLSSPGHYTLRPKVAHPDDMASPLVVEGGVLDTAKTWANLQHVHYMVLGVGDWIVVPEVIDGELQWRHVSTADVYAVTRPTAPSIWIGLWELRLRETQEPRTGKTRSIYTWDVWDIADPEHPSLRVYEADHSGGLGADRSAEFLTQEIDGVIVRGAIKDADYAWRFDNGKPFFPHVRYTAWATGGAWNAWMFRGVYRGSLNAMLLRTLTNRAAIDSIGSMIISTGVIPPGLQTHGAGTATPTLRLPITPGMWAACQADGNNPTVTEVRPGQNLEKLDAYAGSYAAGLGARYGLGTGEAVRTSGNAWSAAALFVTDKDRTQEAERSEPMFRDSDLEMLRKVAALLRIAGIATYPERGYSISYTRPEPSPEMQRSKREDLDWREKNGTMSPIDVMIALHPGMSRASAAAEIVRVKVEKLELERMVQEALLAAGLVEPPPVAPVVPAVPVVPAESPEPEMDPLDPPE